MQINTVTHTLTNISDNKYHKFMYEMQHTTEPGGTTGGTKLQFHSTILTLSFTSVI